MASNSGAARSLVVAGHLTWAPYRRSEAKNESQFDVPDLSLRHSACLCTATPQQQLALVTATTEPISPPNVPASPKITPTATPSPIVTPQSPTVTTTPTPTPTSIPTATAIPTATPPPPTATPTSTVQPTNTAKPTVVPRPTATVRPPASRITMIFKTNFDEGFAGFNAGVEIEPRDLAKMDSLILPNSK